jgi:hypothetical protein
MSNAFLRVFIAAFGRSWITDGTSPFWSCSTNFFASSGSLSKDRITSHGMLDMDPTTSLDRKRPLTMLLYDY